MLSFIGLALVINLLFIGYAKRLIIKAIHDLGDLILLVNKKDDK